MYTVLLVDDEPAILEMEKRAIQNRVSNFEVIGEAYNVEMAKEIYLRDKPKVILTDIRMPKESGIELIKYLSEKGDSEVILVAVSGYDDFDYVHDAFMYGAYDYLLKPVEPKKIVELFQRIAQLLCSLNKQDGTDTMMGRSISSGELVSEIDTFIRENLTADNSIVSICSRFGISQPYLSKIFKTHRKTTYNDYLTTLKIEKAKGLLELENDYLIGEVAEMVGFADQFYFSKVFKNLTGYTPREYRKR